ncbi:hypothetical protein [Sorangium sp. So ce341]|uniref:hypothetical protein n=1 Tax=Sorangium sp. So ce341 TaxID=3133302 RepID=UPI003F5FAA78
MIVGVVCEGSTDSAVLRAVCAEVLGNAGLVFRLLQPDFDRIRQRDPAAPGPGWQGVRKFLQDPANMYMAATLDVLVVQVDADIRELPEINKQLDVDEDEELRPLCSHVKGWMAGGAPDSAVIVLPRESTEAWIVAAVTRKKDVEAIDDPAQALVDAGVIRAVKGKPDKRAADYETHIPALLAKLKEPKELRAIPELARFVGKLGARARSVSAKKRSKA